MSYRKNKNWYVVSFIAEDYNYIEESIRSRMKSDDDDIVDVKITETDRRYTVIVFIAKSDS